jgi:hypothetical protein
MQHVEKSQQETSNMEDRLVAVNRFTNDVMAVMLACSGNTDMMTAVHSMADIGRSLLAGPASGGRGGGAVVLSSDDGAGAWQRYVELQERVRTFCGSRRDAAAALACMEAAVTRAVL